jgi:hypothetical protein
MSTSHPIPFAKTNFHHGKPVPTSYFNTWIEQQSGMTANSHPRPLSLSTDWLNGTEYLHGLFLSAHSAENLSTTFQAFVSRRGAHLSSAQSIGIKRYKE